MPLVAYTDAECKQKHHKGHRKTEANEEAVKISTGGVWRYEEPNILRAEYHNVDTPGEKTEPIKLANIKERGHRL